MELAEIRMEICRKCPLYVEDPIVGPKCDNRKYLDVDEDKAYPTWKPGRIRGCNCLLKYKVMSPSNKCIAGKW